jgi:hypothetical protein
MPQLAVWLGFSGAGGRRRREDRAMADGARDRAWRSAAIGALVAFNLAAPAQALDEKPDEKGILKACQRSFCEIALKKQAKPADLKCAIAKTWAKKQIKESIDSKVVWHEGDARCGATLTLTAADITAALTQPKYKLQFPVHTVHCEIEKGKGEVMAINVTLAPKIVFEGGEARKAWIKVSNVEAPAGYKVAIWAVAKLEDGLGLFQGSVLKEINKLVHETCPANYGTATAQAKK